MLAPQQRTAPSLDSAHVKASPAATALYTAGAGEGAVEGETVTVRVADDVGVPDCDDVTEPVVLTDAENETDTVTLAVRLREGDQDADGDGDGSSISQMYRQVSAADTSLNRLANT